MYIDDRNDALTDAKVYVYASNFSNEKEEEEEEELNGTAYGQRGKSPSAREHSNHLKHEGMNTLCRCSLCQCPHFCIRVTISIAMKNF